MRFTAVAAGFVALVAGSLLLEFARLRVRLLASLEEVLAAFYGESFRQDREAVDILMKALDSADPAAREAALRNLERLTGRSFGSDAQAWRTWWEAHRSTFRRADAPAAEPGRGERR